MKNRKRRNRVFILFILLLTVSIGFAALSTQLNVVGTTGISKNTWSVYWANVGNESGIVPTTSPTISNEDETHPNTIISFGVNLAKPGDFYEFEVDAVNAGTIDAMLSTITTTITSNGEPAIPPAYILYNVTYSDGETPTTKHLLSKKSGITSTKERYKIRIEFSRDITEAQLDEMPNDGLSYDIDLEASYVQADNTATVRPKDYLKVMNRENSDKQPAFDNTYEIKKSQVEKIYTLNTLELPSELQNSVIQSWDVSVKEDGNIMAYALDTDSNSKYEIYLAQKGGVKANPNSSKLFNLYSNVTYIDTSNLITDDVENMSGMFQGCGKLVDIVAEENWITGKVTDMGFLFNYCSVLSSIDVSHFDTSNVTNMQSMFSHCSALSSVDVSHFDTSNVANMRLMFSYCSSLTSLDISDFDTNKVTDMTAMFQASSSITSFIMPDDYKRIDDAMFNHMSSYSGESFTIPKTVTTVGDTHLLYDFGKDETFTKFIVEDGSTTLKVVDDILYTYDGTKLISVPRGKKFTNNTYIIPEGITFLTELSFSRNKNIDIIIIPNSYEIIRYIDADNNSYGFVNSGNSLSVAIYQFTTIKEYDVKNDNPRYMSYEGCIYSKDGTELIAVPLHYAGILNVKTGTTTIGQEALWSYLTVIPDSITEINIPASVTTIEANQLTTLNKLITNGVVINIDSNNTSYEISNNKIVAK